MAREIILRLDEDDWDTIQSELAAQQATFHQHEFDTGGSNTAGAILADVIRSLNEYRDLYEQTKETP